MRIILTNTARLFKNRNFILILSLVVGLAAGRPVAAKTEVTVIPLLALVMTITALGVTSGKLASLKNLSRFVLVSLFLNYIILGGLILILGKLLIQDNELWTGFVVMAAVPPAPAVVPFTAILGGDVLFSLIGMTGGYLAALFITPAALVFFLGTQFIDPARILIIMVELVIIPVIISRILLYFKLAKYIEPWRGLIVNWSLFIIIFTLVGFNRQAFFGEFNILLRISLIAIIITFGLSYVLGRISQSIHLKMQTTVSVILIGTVKNYALAGGLLLSLFSERSAIPPSICVFFGILQIVWLGFWLKKSE